MDILGAGQDQLQTCVELMNALVGIFYFQSGEKGVLHVPFFCCFFIGEDDGEHYVSLFAEGPQFVDDEAEEDVIVLDDSEQLHI